MSAAHNKPELIAEPPSHKSQLISELYAVLDAVKEASLFVDDDGTVRVSSEPYISDELFARICAVLAKVRGEQ